LLSAELPKSKRISQLPLFMFAVANVGVSYADAASLRGCDDVVGII
jgi:hypothetical protein